MFSPCICRPRAQYATGNLFAWGPFIACEHFFYLPIPVFKQIADVISYASVECEAAIFYFWTLTDLLARRPDDPSVGPVSQRFVVHYQKEKKNINPSRTATDRQEARHISVALVVH